jgi:hypothetical protein
VRHAGQYGSRRRAQPRQAISLKPIPGV